MYDGVAMLIAFCIGVLVTAFTAILLSFPGRLDEDANKLCQEAGFHGGTNDEKMGHICFNYVSERLVK